MKKKISIVGMFLLLCVAFVAGINMTGNNVQALTPPRVTPTAIPDYYFASYDNAHEFVAWFKSSDAKTGNNGVFAQMINSHEEYGYLLVPYYEDAANSVSVSANAIEKGKFLYYSKNPAYSIKVEPLYDVQDKKYDALGIVQYIKDKCKISDFSSEYKPSGIHFRPGEATHTYLFAERIYKVGGERTECIAYRDTSYNAYTKDVIDYSLGIVFIKNGMRVTILYDKRISGESIISSLNTLKFKEEVLNQANYEKTKAEIKNGPGGASSVGDEDDKEESADEKNEIEYKIIGKTKVACGSTYKYKAKLTGINGKVKWSVNKKKLARISKDGKLKALKKGTVTVKAKVKGVSCSIKVKIVGKDMLSDNETATAKTTTIKLEKGDTCKIKIKKNSKIKLGRKKIVKVSNKGVMKALKVGKCTVTVKKGKKTWKYNVVVTKKSVADNQGHIPTVTPTVAPTATPTVAPTATPTATPTPRPTPMCNGLPTPRPEKSKILADTWLAFDVDFYSDVLPQSAKVISGKVKYNENMDTIIEIEANGNIIASVKLEAGEETFSIPIDLSELTVGDKVYVKYSRLGGNVDEYETEKNFVYHMVWPSMADYEIVE